MSESVARDIAILATHLASAIERIDALERELDEIKSPGGADRLQAAREAAEELFPRPKRPCKTA